jgi:hypothetical protein
MSRDLSKATPRVREFSEKLISEVKRLLGITLFVVEVDRPFDVQVAYYAQSREPLSVVNKLRKRVGLAPITDSENKRAITWTMASNHITNLENDKSSDDLSRAIDIGIKDKNGHYVADANADTNKDKKADFKQIGIIGKMIDSGMIWGGDWKGKKYDPQHWEEPKGLFEDGSSGGGGAVRVFDQNPISEGEIDKLTASEDMKI